MHVGNSSAENKKVALIQKAADGGSGAVKMSRPKLPAKRVVSPFHTNNNVLNFATLVQGKALVWPSTPDDGGHRD